MIFIKIGGSALLMKTTTLSTSLVTPITLERTTSSCGALECTLKLQCDANVDVVNAYNKMHVGFHVKMEWGIGGLKQK